MKKDYSLNKIIFNNYTKYLYKFTLYSNIDESHIYLNTAPSLTIDKIVSTSVPI